MLIAGSCLLLINQFEVETPASRLDKEWLADFFKALLAFFILMNLLFLIPATITGGGSGGQLLIVIIRVFGGSCVSVSQQIHRGFNLYNELDPKDFDEGRDSEFLYVMRIVVLLFLCLFFAYLLISFCVLICVFGPDGNNQRNHRSVRLFKRIPFGNLVY